MENIRRRPTRRFDPRRQTDDHGSVKRAIHRQSRQGCQTGEPCSLDQRIAISRILPAPWMVQWLTAGQEH
jgi:hypothetical protein